MFDSATIFQRTAAGREEIHKKSHGLTQSERLVLIMVDGVSSFQEIRAKLPVLHDERFERAFRKLLLKELVLEVFIPVEGQTPEELERTIIDRFLQQDALDPVTIILEDPEEMFDAHAASVAIPASGAATDASPEPASPDPTFEPTLPPSRPEPSAGTRPEQALDVQHVLLADALAAEVRARHASRTPSSSRGIHASDPASEMALPASTSFLAPLAAVHWGYWLIVGGSSFILGFVLGRAGG
ncbi:MAG TPA: hypothetical protein VEC01_07160 [Noviherbaspirillum sp.]|uniref:hypothetical protein n=1 Tax=Noviherbaspirillum sp. TaxID=1926288 RepID=UPI002D705496|nr:hypothetical protein [Noviherbaspirillum sp.]HYD95085.1 hypothetical protein [Noviherbaspirillum sp.]